MTHRQATAADCALLAAWNHQLIREEAHRNTMTVPELAQRLTGWLATDYTAIIFAENARPVAYALYREQPAEIYLRQFFVEPSSRRRGLGRSAMKTLISSLWPKDKRLTVEALVANPVGISFWRSLGYQDYSLALEIMPLR